MSTSTIRTALFMIYLVGNALTYRHLVRTDPQHALETVAMLTNLGISCTWPLYWIMHLVR